MHVEVQNQAEAAFTRRMFTYHYRLLDRYDRAVASLAVLGDPRPAWRPARFAARLWGCEVAFRFPIVKLLDYRRRWKALEESRSPFATVVMAHLKAQETRGDVGARGEWRFSLLRRLYERGHQRADILNLYRFLDWVLELPEAAERRFVERVMCYEKEKRMPHMTSIERFGIEKGLEKGLEKGIEKGVEKGIRQSVLRVVERRFGSLSAAQRACVEAISGERLVGLLEAAATATSLDAFAGLLAADDPTTRPGRSRRSAGATTRGNGRGRD